MEERKDIQSQEAVQPKGKKRRRRRRRRRGPSISTIIAVIIVLIGAGLIAYPTFSDWWNSYHQSRAIANYVQAVEEMDPELKEKMIKRARKYNKKLLKKGDRYNMSDADKAEYESILDLNGSGVIGYIQINSIGVNLPVYHGVSEAVLQVAIGHIEGSSLPVGGPSTHAAVSGHRGLPSARLFTDLDKLVEGDTFTMTVLDETITYEVDQIRIVEPADLSDLNIERGKDYMTLITCTPYGINTHRMLVRGHRIENITGMVVIPAEAVQIPNYVAVPAVGLPMLFVYLIGALIYYRGKGDAPDMERALEELREQAGELPAVPGVAAVAAEAEANAKPKRKKRRRRRRRRKVATKGTGKGAKQAEPSAEQAAEAAAVDAQAEIAEQAVAQEPQAEELADEAPVQDQAPQEADLAASSEENPAPENNPDGSVAEAYSEDETEGQTSNEAQVELPTDESEEAPNA